MSNHLISLELQGYKTFASKTEFKFPAQLTAIVGPNGSGKSNIADSIRWVLGEQAYSLLRGRKTIDMIFSGSEQRARASMASASITFDNSTGWLPIDFNEVNLTRRAYRNGENEYLINNQKVRLKEINELLANSGLAERNYTIIGQGLVDSALSLKPEDRRSFFEEAAGIGLYRSRRSEANKRLDKTTRNMERVNDIVSELKPRLQSLEKQQEKAVSYNQIDADLKLLLQDWYGYHWHQTQENLREAIKVNARQQDKVNQARDERKKFETKLDVAQKTLGQKRVKVSEMHHALAELHEEKEINARQIAVLTEREQAQKERLVDLTQSVELDKTQISSLEKEIVDLEHSHTDSADEYSEMQQDLRDAQHQLEVRQARRDEIEKQIRDSENAVNQSSQQILRLQTRLDSQKKQIDIKKSDISQMKDRNKKNQRHFEEMQGALAEKRQQLLSIKNDMEQYIDTRTAVAGALSEIKAETNDFQKDREKCERLLQNLQGQYKLLEEAEQSMVGFSSGAKEIITAVRNGKLHGDFRLLLDILKIPQKYEVAVVSALGEVIEGIIINSSDDLDGIIEYITNSNTPRSILVDQAGSQIGDKQGQNAVNLLPAVKVVSNENEAGTVINHLLSAIFIADDVRSAQNERKNLKPGQRIVTLTGEVFAADGTVIIGKELRTKHVERKREKVSIAKEITETEHTLAEIEEKLSGLKAIQKTRESELEEINQNLQKKETRRSNLSVEIHKLQFEKEQLDKQIADGANRIDRGLDDVKTEGAIVLELTNKIQNFQHEIKERKQSTRTLYQQFHEIGLENLRGNVMDLNSKLAVASQMVTSYETRLTEKKLLLDRFRSSAEQAKQRVENIKNLLVQINSQLKEIRSRDKIVNQHISSMSEKTQPLEAQVEREITDQGSFLEEVDRARQRFAIAERHKMQASLKVEKLREKLERYQQKIGEDFGIFTGEEEPIFGPKPLPIEGVVSKLPMLKRLPEGISDQISQKKSLLRRLGPVNPNAQQEYRDISERYSFLTGQLFDLQKAENDLRKIVDELDELMRTEFLNTFKKVAVEFENIFTQLFNGGTAKLVVEDEENILDSGIEIEATLPGRRKQELALLSGGERSLTAVALIFALLKISPTPFCILDEIDAMLDESNVMRVGELLKELSDTTQFIIITHNRNTVQLADVIYGVTMGKDSVSQVISLKLDELTDEMVH